MIHGAQTFSPDVDLRFFFEVRQFRTEIVDPLLKSYSTGTERGIISNA
jgi:hypothetical protein